MKRVAWMMASVVWLLAVTLTLPGCGKKKEEKPAAEPKQEVEPVSIVGVRGEQYEIVVQDVVNEPAGTVTMEGSDDFINVKNRLAAELPNFRTCFLQQKKEATDLSGMVQVSFRVKPDGGVVNIATDGRGWTDGKRGMQVEMCLTKRLTTWKFPRGIKDVDNDFVLVFR